MSVELENWGMSWVEQNYMASKQGVGTRELPVGRNGGQGLVRMLEPTCLIGSQGLVQGIH